MRVLLIAGLAVAGLLVSPLLRLIIVRLSVPSGEPWRRTCPSCQTALRPLLAPAGRCASCRARLGPPVLTVEIATAALLGLLAARIHPGLVLAATCWLVVCAIPLACIDAATRRLPDVLTGAAFAGTAGFLLLDAATSGPWSSLVRALLGALAYTGFCLLLFLISPSGMGAGDVKLAASLGAALAWLSWLALFGGALAGFVLGALYGIALMLAGRANRKSQLPFGPFLIAGAFLLLLLTGS